MADVKQSPLKSAADNAKPTDELGITGLRQFAGMVEETYLRELHYPQAYDKYNEMRRRDPTLASLLHAVKLLARPVTWTVEPASSQAPDQRAADFVAQCLADMSTTIDDVIEDLLSAIPFGWAWSEIVYKRRKGPKADPASKYGDGAIGWRKFAPRMQSSFYKWEFDAHGGTQGMWQWSRSDPKQRYLPIEKSIHFIAERDGNNPEGMSILESMYESWHFVKNLQIILGIGFERSFVGLPVFEYVEGYEPSADDKALVANTGKALRVDEKAYVAAPANIKFHLETTTNSNAASLLDTIKQFRIWMLMVILADFLALGTVASGGSYSLGQDKSELFLMAVDGWLDKIAHPDKLGVFNRYAIPRLLSYNTFEGMSDYPRLKHSSVQKPNLPALSNYLQSLSAFIQPDAVLEAELRRMANLPPPDPDSVYTSPVASNTPKPQTGDAQGDAELAHDVPWRTRLKPRGTRYFEMQFLQALKDFQSAANDTGSPNHGS